MHFKGETGSHPAPDRVYGTTEKRLVSVLKENPGLEEERRIGVTVQTEIKKRDTVLLMEVSVFVEKLTGTLFESFDRFYFLVRHL